MIKEPTALSTTVTDQFNGSDPPAHSDAAAPPTRDPLCALLEGAGDGNQRDFAFFYEGTAAHVFALIGCIVDDSHHRVTVMEGTYLEVWRTAACYTSLSGAPLTWVLMIARRLASNRVREHSGAPGQALTVTNHTPGRAHQESLPGQVRPATAATLRSSIPRSLNDLSVSERACLNQMFLGARTYREVADDLRIPPPVVQHSLRNGLRHLVDQAANSAR